MDFDPRDFDDSRDRNEDSRDRDYERWPDREHGHDPRDVFTRDLDLPRGREREIVRVRDREYALRGSESRTLATVGAFRVVSRVNRITLVHLSPSAYFFRPGLTYPFWSTFFRSGRTLR